MLWQRWKIGKIAKGEGGGGVFNKPNRGWHTDIMSLHLASMCPVLCDVWNRRARFLWQQHWQLPAGVRTKRHLVPRFDSNNTTPLLLYTQITFSTIIFNVFHSIYVACGICFICWLTFHVLITRVLDLFTAVYDFQLTFIIICCIGSGFQ